MECEFELNITQDAGDLPDIGIVTIKVEELFGSRLEVVSTRTEPEGNVIHLLKILNGNVNQASAYVKSCFIPDKQKKSVYPLVAENTLLKTEYWLRVLEKHFLVYLSVDSTTRHIKINGKDWDTKELAGKLNGIFADLSVPVPDLASMRESEIIARSRLITDLERNVNDAAGVFGSAYEKYPTKVLRVLLEWSSWNRRPQDPFASLPLTSGAGLPRADARKFAAASTRNTKRSAIESPSSGQAPLKRVGGDRGAPTIGLRAVDLPASDISKPNTAVCKPSNCNTDSLAAEQTATTRKVRPTIDTRYFSGDSSVRAHSGLSVEARKVWGLDEDESSGDEQLNNAGPSTSRQIPSPPSQEPMEIEATSSADGAGASQGGPCFGTYRQTRLSPDAADYIPLNSFKSKRHEESHVNEVVDVSDDDGCCDGNNAAAETSGMDSPLVVFSKVSKATPGGSGRTAQNAGPVHKVPTLFSPQASRMYQPHPMISGDTGKEPEFLMDTAPVEQPGPQRPLDDFVSAQDALRNAPRENDYRPVFIDGMNIAFHHSRNTYFSGKGLFVAVRELLELGIKDVAVVLPRSIPQKARKGRHTAEGMDFVAKLRNMKVVVEAPSRWIFDPLGNRKLMGGKVTCHDDFVLLEQARYSGGIILSNDQFRDHARDNPQWEDVISRRLLMYNFTIDGNKILLPRDPLGGANKMDLHTFLSYAPDDPRPVPLSDDELVNATERLLDNARRGIAPSIQTLRTSTADVKPDLQQLQQQLQTGPNNNSNNFSRFPGQQQGHNHFQARHNNNKSAQIVRQGQQQRVVPPEIRAIPMLPDQEGDGPDLPMSRRAADATIPDPGPGTSSSSTTGQGRVLFTERPGDTTILETEQRKVNNQKPPRKDDLTLFEESIAKAQGVTPPGSWLTKPKGGSTGQKQLLAAKQAGRNAEPQVETRPFNEPDLIILDSIDSDEDLEPVSVTRLAACKGDGELSGRNVFDGTGNNDNNMHSSRSGTLLSSGSGPNQPHRSATEPNFGKGKGLWGGAGQGSQERKFTARQPFQDQASASTFSITDTRNIRPFNAGGGQNTKQGMLWTDRAVSAVNNSYQRSGFVANNLPIFGGPAFPDCGGGDDVEVLDPFPSDKARSESETARLANELGAVFPINTPVVDEVLASPQHIKERDPTRLANLVMARLDEMCRHNDQSSAAGN